MAAQKQQKFVDAMDRLGVFDSVVEEETGIQGNNTSCLRRFVSGAEQQQRGNTIEFDLCAHQTG